MIVILMGTTGAGKTTVGTLLAGQLGWEFADADDFHSSANIEKMRNGIPLTDEDRAPWLAALHERIIEWNGHRANTVLACSALKEIYREQLAHGADVKWVYLKGSFNEIAQRLAVRKGHYTGLNLLESQFAALEEPLDAVTIEIDQVPGEIVSEIRKKLRL